MSVMWELKAGTSKRVDFYFIFFQELLMKFGMGGEVVAVGYETFFVRSVPLVIFFLQLFKTLKMTAYSKHLSHLKPFFATSD